MFPSCWVMIAPTASGPDGWILQSPFSRPSLPPYVRSDNDCRLDSIPFQNICRVSRISKVSSHPAHSTITSTAHQEYINIYIYNIILGRISSSDSCLFWGYQSCVMMNANPPELAGLPIHAWPKPQSNSKAVAVMIWGITSERIINLAMKV